MKSFNTASFEAKNRFSLTFSDGFIILLDLTSRIGDTGVAAAPSSPRTWFNIGGVAHVYPADLAVE